MKIKPEDVSVPARGIAFGEDFVTNTPSEKQLADAVRLGLQPKDSSIARIRQQDAMKLAQAPHVIAANRGLGNFTSLGTKTLESIGRLVSQDVFEKDSNTSRFVSTAMEAFSVFDDITAGLNSVPFVGAALSVVLTIVRLTLDAKQQNTPLPPRLLMNPDHDERIVTEALGLLRTGSDWTPLFLPRMPPEGAPQQENGGWDLVEFEQQGGITFRRGDDSWIGNFGCAPGDLFFVDAGVKSRIEDRSVTIPNDSPTPPHSLVLRKGNNPKVLRNLVFSLGEWFPGLAALGRSVWSMVGTADSAAMFNVDGYKVIGGWTDFHNSLERYREFADDFLGRDLRRMSKANKRYNIRVYLATVGAAFHDARTADGRQLSQEQLLDLALDANRRPLGETVGLQASRAASNLVMRQYGAAETRLNALVSKDAPALRDKGLREHFMRERTQQLDAGRFDDVDLDEVPDKKLRSRIASRLRTSGGGQSNDGLSGPDTFVDPVSIAREREFWDEVDQKVPRPPGMTGLGVPYEPDDKGGGSVLAATLLAAAGIGGTAFYLNRKRRKSRKET